MMSHVSIDSLKLKKSQSQRFGFGRNGKRLEIHCIFKDLLEKNFYRIKVYWNDTTDVEKYRLFDDQYTNGKITDLQVGRVTVDDTCRIQLISLDKFTYEYYRTLRIITEAIVLWQI